jgi:hypothetical protein
MINKQDIFKIAVSVIMIHIMLMFVFEGFILAGQGVDDTIVLSKLENTFGSADVVESQIAKPGLVPKGVTSESECNNFGGNWVNGQCLDDLQKSVGVDFTFFDIILGVLKVAKMMGNFILFLGSVVFFSLILSFKLMPLIPWTPVQFLITVALWSYQALIIYYIWAFVSNWRGQR